MAENYSHVTAKMFRKRRTAIREKSTDRVYSCARREKGLNLLTHSLVALLLPFHVSLFAEVSLHRTCGGQGEYEILQGKGFLPTRDFNQAYLRKYFSRYLSYAETTEIYVLLIGDRKLARENDIIDLVLSSPPVQTKAPIAHFWKIGRNAFFEFRDSAGKADAIVLSGTSCRRLWMVSPR